MSFSVAPPHSAASIKKRICNAEIIQDPGRANLYLSPSSQSPMEENGRVSIASSTGAGFMPEEPLALVVKSRPEDSFIAAASFIPGAPATRRSPSIKNRPWKLGGGRPTARTPVREPRYRKDCLSNLSFHQASHRFVQCIIESSPKLLKSPQEDPLDLLTPLYHV
jgi:hypothetical protein